MYILISSAKLLIFPLSCKFSRWNIVKINRKCVASNYSAPPEKQISKSTI